MTFPKEWVRPVVNPKLNRTSFFKLVKALDNIEVEDSGWQSVQNFITHFGLDKARLFFIGNGGSAAIASHLATDAQKNGRFPTFGPGDCSLMSCYGNDYGFDHVYSEQIERHGQLGDVLFAISSSGMSENILRAVDCAKKKMMNVVTLSGFGEGNFLRSKGQVNFYVPSNEYGTVEISHLAILHSILDEAISAEATK
jgi:D-sedoheptulose 7-phosphate isomerase